MSQLTNLIFWTDIGTPYRTDMFNYMAKCTPSLKVWYQAASLNTRSWDLNAFKNEYPYLVSNSIHLFYRRAFFFLSPKLIIKSMLLPKYSILILALGWADPNVLIVCFLKRLGLIKAQLAFWSEANYLTNGARNDNLLKKYVRTWVYSSPISFQISSGYMTRLTFSHWCIPVKKYVNLFNTIQETIFKPSIYPNWAIPQDGRNRLLIVARLIEDLKGIINFMHSLGNDRISKVFIDIVGDGPDTDKIIYFINSNNLGEHVRLHGQLNPSDLRKLYLSTTIFVLPSFSDPCPLSVVEALWAGLPLLLSSRCGNHYEALEEGHNGYLFDPSYPSSITKAFDNLVNSHEKMYSFSKRSRSIYDTTYSLKRVVDQFLKDLPGNCPLPQ